MNANSDDRKSALDESASILRSGHAKSLTRRVETIRSRAVELKLSSLTEKLENIDNRIQLFENGSDRNSVALQKLIHDASKTVLKAYEEKQGSKAPRNFLAVSYVGSDHGGRNDANRIRNGAKRKQSEKWCDLDILGLGSTFDPDTLRPILEKTHKTFTLVRLANKLGLRVPLSKRDDFLTADLSEIVPQAKIKSRSFRINIDVPTEVDVNSQDIEIRRGPYARKSRFDIPPVFSRATSYLDGKKMRKVNVTLYSLTDKRIVCTHGISIAGVIYQASEPKR